MTFEDALISVWQQALLDEARRVELNGESFPVRKTRNRSLRQVDFEFDGRKLRGIEQNPRTTSRWAKLARAGKKVMQFTEAGRWLGVVAEGKLTLYGKRRGS